MNNNLTVTRLGDDAQFDNEYQSNHHYMRPELYERAPHLSTTAATIRAWGIVAGLFWLIASIFTWILAGLFCWRTSFIPSLDCVLMSWLARLATAAPVLIGIAACLVYLWRTAMLTLVESWRGRITRDRYSNPVDAKAVLAPNWNAPAFFASAQQAEITMAPFKQLPAGLDSLSMSSPSGKAAAAAEDGASIGITPVPITEWLQWLDERPHLLLAAETGGGKTTTTKAVLARRIFQGEHLVVIDPHSSHWMGITGIGGGEDWKVVTAALDAVEAEYRQRLQARERHLETTGEELPVSHWTRLTVLLDEANNTQTNLDTAPRGQVTPWKRFVKTLGSGARKVNISIMLLCQSAVLEDLNISGPMRQNFTRIALDDRTVKQMIKDDEMDRSRKQALYAALEGRAYPATMVRGSQVYLLDRTGLDQVRLPRPDEARACLWTPPPRTPTSVPVPTGTDERDALARALFARGAKFRPVAEVLRKRGYSIDNNRLSELYREVNGVP